MRDGFASERHIKKPLVAVNELSPSVNRITKKDRKEQILEVCASGKSFTPLEISKYMKASPITIREYLRELVKEGKLGFTGTFRNRSYHIINKD